MKRFLLLVLMSIGVFLSCQKQDKPEDKPVVPESLQYPMGLITNSKAKMEPIAFLSCAKFPTGCKCDALL